SEEHTSELQSLAYLVCCLLLEKKKQRRIQGSDRDRQAIHGLEDPGKIITLQGEQLLQRSPPILLVIRQNHGAHVWNLFLTEKHVLGAAQSDAFRSECTSLYGVTRDVGIGTNFHAAMRVRPL